VFTAYVTPDGGPALTGRELYLPEKWADDRDRCRAAGIGDEVAFATKPELARPAHTVSEAWKQRLRLTQKTIVTGTGAKAAVTVERTSYRQCLTPGAGPLPRPGAVRRREPSRWADWAVPCPIGAEEINQRRP